MSKESDRKDEPSTQVPPERRQGGFLGAFGKKSGSPGLANSVQPEETETGQQAPLGSTDQREKRLMLELFMQSGALSGRLRRATPTSGYPNELLSDSVLAELTFAVSEFEQRWSSLLAPGASEGLIRQYEDSRSGLLRQLEVLQEMLRRAYSRGASLSSPPCPDVDAQMRAQVREEEHRRNMAKSKAKIEALRKETQDLMREAQHNTAMSHRRQNERWMRTHFSGTTGFYCPRCLRQYPDHHRICLSCGPYSDSLYGSPHSY